jgi:hypothetical protein
MMTRAAAALGSQFLAPVVEADNLRRRIFRGSPATRIGEAFEGLAVQHCPSRGAQIGVNEHGLLRLSADRSLALFAAGHDLGGRMGIFNQQQIGPGPAKDPPQTFFPRDFVREGPNTFALYPS